MFGKNDFDFIPDMDLDGDHDAMDFVILDTVLSDDETYEDDDCDSSDEG
jgi:hypothetical protein